MEMLRTWLTFCSERFELFSHGLMIFCFSAGNSAMGLALVEQSFQIGPFILALAVTFSFFFRLRCFDEIKDFEFDLKHNPTRPLARGLLSVTEVKVAILIMTVFELVLIHLFAPHALAWHCIAVAFSFLMYKEFFIGQLIRPHLATYALLHTISSAFIGYSIISIVTSVRIPLVVPYMYLLALVNWGQFNLFEFARKTFATCEEKVAVDSYTSKFGRGGAVVLSLSQILLALIPLFFIADFFVAAVTNSILALIVFVFALKFATSDTKDNASIFRKVTSAYLLLFYLIIALSEVV